MGTRVGDNQLPAVDLFAGAGGLSLGLEQAGFSIVRAVEFDRDAAATYSMAHPATTVCVNDIADLSFSDLRGRVALVAGGPPCQPWSSGGLRRAEDDPRNGLPQFLRVIEETRPEAVLMENVAGLAAGSRRPYLDAFMARLEQLGFTVRLTVLAAPAYGVPQKRVRLFVVATRGSAAQVPPPSHGPGTSLRFRPAGEVIASTPTGAPNRAIVTYARNPDLRPDPYDGHLFNGGGRPIDLAKPSPTLLASMGGNKTPWVDTLGVVPSYHRHLRAGGAPRNGLVPGARRITVEEASLLQGFPPSARFAGPRSSQYRQVGNAVPPPLAAAVARQLATALSPRTAAEAAAS